MDIWKKVQRTISCLPWDYSLHVNRSNTLKLKCNAVQDVIVLPVQCGKVHVCAVQCSAVQCGEMHSMYLHCSLVQCITVH